MTDKYRIWDINHNWYLPDDYLKRIRLDANGTVWWVNIPGNGADENLTDQMIVEHAVAKGKFDYDIFVGDVVDNQFPKIGCEHALVIYDNGPKLRCKCGQVYNKVNWVAIEVSTNVHISPGIMDRTQ
jgi:hypothetical protein